MPRYPPSEESRHFGFIAWLLGVLGVIIALVFKSDDEFVLFHAKQSLLMWAAIAVIWIIVWIFSFILYFTGLGLLAIIFWPIRALALLYGIAMAIIGAIKAYNGEWWQAPIVGLLVK